MNPRPLKELLQILLDEVEQNGINEGLCQLIIDFYEVDEISGSECIELQKWIRIYFHPQAVMAKLGESQPRIEFLKNEIEKLT